MSTLTSWMKSSYSGGGQGDACVEVFNGRTHIAVRDSKTPTRAVLTFPAPAFAAFLKGLKGRREQTSGSPAVATCGAEGRLRGRPVATGRPG